MADRLLLESGAPDGYLLEDSSGVVLTEVPTDYASAVIADAPISYWRLGEPSGTTAVDEMGLNNGSYVNTPTLSQTSLLPNDTDTSVDFDDGTTQHMRVPAHSSLDLGDGPFSIEMWFALANPASGANRYLFANGSVAPTIIAVGSSGTTRIQADSYANQNVLRSSVAIVDTLAHYLVVTKAAGDTTVWRMYIDGIDVTSYLNVTSTGTTDTATDLFIGSTHVPDNGFDGFIDEVAVYDYVLTPAQVGRHYESRNQAPVSGNTGTAAIAFGWATAATGTEDFIASGGSAWGFATASTGAAGASGTAASAFGWAVAATGTEDFIATGASAFGWATAATGEQGFGGTAAVAFGWATGALGELAFTGTGGIAFGWATAGTGVVANPIDGTAASAWGWSTASTGVNAPPITGTAASAWGFATASTGNISGTITVSSIPDLKTALANDVWTEIIVTDGVYTIDAANANDTNSLYIVGGAYAARTNPVVIRAETVGGVTFDGAGMTGGGIIFQDGVHHQTWKGFHFADMTPEDTGVVVFGGDPTYDPPHDITMQYTWLDADCHRVDAPSNNEQGFYFAHADGRGPYNIIIEDFIIEGMDSLSLWSGIHAFHGDPTDPGADNVIIRRGQIRGTVSAIVLWYNTGPHDDWLIEDVWISNCDTWAVRWESDDASNVILRRVVSTSSGSGGFYSDLGSPPLTGLTLTDCYLDVDNGGGLASAWGWSTASTGDVVSGATGTAAVAFGWSTAATGEEAFSGVSAVTFGWAVAATGGLGIIGVAASEWGFALDASGAAGVSGFSAIEFGWGMGGLGDVVPPPIPFAGDALSRPNTAVGRYPWYGTGIRRTR